jgi:hypothetical protein
MMRIDRSENENALKDVVLNNPFNIFLYSLKVKDMSQILLQKRIN